MSDFPLPRILEFVRTVVPFDTLSQSELDQLAVQMEIAFYPRGRKIIKRGDPPPGFLHMIQVGAACIQLTDEAGEIITVDVRSEGEVNMTHHGSHLPVLKNGRLVGVVSEHDFRM